MEANSEVLHVCKIKIQIDFLQARLQTSAVRLPVHNIVDIIVHTPQHDAAIISRLLDDWQHRTIHYVLGNVPGSSSTAGSGKSHDQLRILVARRQPCRPLAPAAQQPLRGSGVLTHWVVVELHPNVIELSWRVPESGPRPWTGHHVREWALRRRSDEKRFRSLSGDEGSKRVHEI